MRNLTTIMSLLSLLWLVGCQNTGAEAPHSADAASTVETAEKSNAQVALYQSAAVYAGKTEYMFIGEDGKEILISDGNDEEQTIKMPDNILEDPDIIEDLPGANPVLIGKQFELHQNAAGDYTEFKLVPGQKIYEKAILATYMSAADYPADMQYYFTTIPDEEEITIYVSHDEETPSKIIPAELLEDPNDLPEDETMLGPNPKVLDWIFVLSYEDDVIKEVSPVPGQRYNEDTEQ